MAAPAALIVAPVQPGMVAEINWQQGLANRVDALAAEERDPVAAVKWASKVLMEMGGTDNPLQAGQALVMDNTFPARCGHEATEKARYAAEESSSLDVSAGRLPRPNASRALGT